MSLKSWSHGEMVIFQFKGEIPKDAKKMKASKVGYIVANSETTGNHHIVEEKEGVEIYEKEGILYLKNGVPVNVFCIMEERHDTITLEPGVYEMESAKEFDYYQMAKRNVSD